MGLKVCKFGGTSLANAAMIRQVADILAADPDRRIVAVSAPGKRDKSDIKVTDLLISCAQNALLSAPENEAVDRVVERFDAIARGLGLGGETADDVRDGLISRLSQRDMDPGRFVDGVKALGEEHCARLVARFLNAQGVEAQFIDPFDAGMLLSNEPGNARVLPQAYERLAALRDRSGTLIFPGFYGFTPSGSLVTFPRGGTDITGAVLAASVGADLYENFTDVDYVLSAQPDFIESPLPITEMTYAEMRELSYAGFSVFHDEALEPVFRKGVPVRIANTANPSAPGTRLILEHSRTLRRVVGIACSTGFCTLYLSKYLMNREKGFGRRLLQIIEESSLSYEHMPSGIDSISVILSERAFTPEVERRVLERIEEELKPDSHSIERGLALVMVVGEGMRFTVGMAAKAAKALAEAGVNIDMINQGSSEISMMYGVKAEDARKAVNALYDAFFRRNGE